MSNLLSQKIAEQQVFDKVVNHLRQQGKKAINASGKCVYRAEDGSKCAFGCLIEDDEYDPFMENLNSDIILSNYYPYSPSLVSRLKQFKNLIADLQFMHDLQDVEDWENFLQSLCNKYVLIYTPPAEA